MKPILFNTEMVKAILEWRKTATRRLPSKRIYDKWFEYNEWVNSVSFTGCSRLSEKEFYEQYPPCQVGDVLYVRETWRLSNPRGDFTRGNRVADITYKADLHTNMIRISPIMETYLSNQWRPSIHMPKEAARIFLKVTDVRVERLQDMTVDDYYHEGADITHGFKDFIRIWNSTIKKKDLHLYSWNANPYVWVIEFERCEKPESEG